MILRARQKQDLHLPPRFSFLSKNFRRDPKGETFSTFAHFSSSSIACGKKIRTLPFPYFPFLFALEIFSTHTFRVPRKRGEGNGSEGVQLKFGRGRFSSLYPPPFSPLLLLSPTIFISPSLWGGRGTVRRRKRRVKEQGEFLVFLGCTHARIRATVYCVRFPEKIETKNYAQLASGAQKQFCLAKVIAESLQRQGRRRGQNLTPPAETPPPLFPTQGTSGRA